MITQNLIDLIEKSEGLRLAPYKDTGGKPTIGYGFTHYADNTPVTMDDPPLTLERAQEMLLQILQPFIETVNRLVPECNQNQKDALTDFEYNEGAGNLESSTLLKTILINPNDTANIPIQFARWKYDSAKNIDPGLITRRANEVKLYFTPAEAA